MFSGYTAGSAHTHTGAAVEPLCLPRNPEWGIYRDGVENIYSNIVYGAEYETNGVPGYMSTLHDHDVPCAVCLVRGKSIVKMFPGEKNGSEITVNVYVKVRSIVFTCLVDLFNF